MTKINKTAARKLWNEGKEFTIVACNCGQNMVLLCGRVGRKTIATLTSLLINLQCSIAATMKPDAIPHITWRTNNPPARVLDVQHLTFS